MRFVVTGGAGFIGSNTVDELVRRGHSVVEIGLAQLATERPGSPGPWFSGTRLTTRSHSGS